MYCPSCGTAVAHGLNYCKQCGVKLNGSVEEQLSKPAEPIPDSLVWAMVVVFIAGLGATIGLMAVMKQVLEFKPDYILAVLLMSFLLIFSIEGVFIWLLLSRRRGSKDAGDIRQLKEQLMKELGESRMASPPVPPLSVSDNTTQSFDPVYSEPKSK